MEEKTATPKDNPTDPKGRSMWKPPCAEVSTEGEFIIATLNHQRTFHSKDMKEILSLGKDTKNYKIHTNLLAYPNDDKTWNIINSDGKMILERAKNFLIADDCVYSSKGDENKILTREGEHICRVECEGAEVNNGRIIFQRIKEGSWTYTAYNGKERREEMTIEIPDDWRGMPSIPIKNCVWGERHFGFLEEVRGEFKLFGTDGRQVGSTHFRNKEVIKKFEETENGFCITTRPMFISNSRGYRYAYDKYFRQKGRAELEEYNSGILDHEPDIIGALRSKDRFKEKVLISGMRKLGAEVESIKMFDEDDLLDEGQFFVAKTHTQNEKSYIGCFNIDDIEGVIKTTAERIILENERSEEREANPDIGRIVDQVQLSLIFERDSVPTAGDVLEFIQIKIKEGRTHQDLLSECLETAHELIEAETFEDIKPPN